MSSPGAVVDCERLGEGFLAQPVNSLTLLAFLAAAVYALWKDGRAARWWAVLLATMAVGSFVFHGPIPPWAEWLHDSSIAAILIFMTSVNVNRLDVMPPAALGAAVLTAAFPPAADALLAVLAVAAVATSAWMARGRPLVGVALATGAAGAMVGRLSATGGPWCNPDSLWQGHGFWHLAAATALALWWMGQSGKPKEGGNKLRQPQPMPSPNQPPPTRGSSQ